MNIGIISFKRAVFFIFIFFLIPGGVAHAVAYNSSAVLGQADYIHGSANRPIPEVGFNNPVSDSLDSVHHRLFVSDSSNNRVLVFLLDSNNDISSSTASYVIGQPDLYSTGAATTQNGLNSPAGVFYNSVSNTLFVADSGSSRVLVFDVSTITNGMNAIAVIGQEDFTSGSSATSQTRLNFPAGIGYSSVSNTLFVGDQSNSRVLAYDLNNLLTTSTPAFSVIGQANFASSTSATSQTGLYQPSKVVYGSVSNTLYVVDLYNSRVLAYDLNNLLTTSTPAFAVIGQADFISNNYSISQTRLSYPMGIDYDSVSNTLYIADTGNNRILAYDLNNLLPTSTPAGAVIGQADFDSGNSGASQTTLTSPQNVVYNNASNTVYITDSNNNRVVVFDASGSNPNAFGILGQPNYTNAGANSMYTREDSLAAPTYSAIDHINHRLFVSDTTNNRVLVFDLDANDNVISDIPSAVIGQADFNGSSGVASDIGLNSPTGLFFKSASNTLFISDAGNNRILTYDLNSLLPTSTPASTVIGQVDFISNSSGDTQNGLNSPQGLSFSSVSNTLFVADFGNNRVLTYNLNNLLPTSTPASAVIGQADFESNVNSLNQTGLMNPRDVVYDSLNNSLFISDTSHHRVLAYDLNSLLTTSTPAVAVIGQVDFDSSMQGTSQTSLNQPYGLDFDSNDNLLFVSEYFNHRVLAYDLNSLLATSTLALLVIGQMDFNNGSNGVSQTNLSSPAGVTYNSANNSLYVGDYANNRVLEFNLLYISNPSILSTSTVGSSYPTTTISAFNNQNTLSYSFFDGALPSGLNFETSTAVISGTPNTSGTSTFVIEARDTSGDTSVFLNRKTFVIQIFELISNNPTSPTISGLSTSTLTISWGANGNPTSTVYQVVGDNDFSSVTTTATSTLLTGLVPNTQYIFGVESQNPGDSSYNSPVNVTASYTLPVAPALAANNFTTSTAKIIFVSTVDSSSTTYAFALSSGGPGFISASGTITSTAVYQTSSTWSNTTTVSGLTPKTAYTFFAVAKNGDGVTSTDGITYGQFTSSSDPISPTASSISTSSMMLSWGANNNPTGTVYRITGDNSFVSVTTTAVSSSLVGLAPNTSYIFNVESKNNDSSYNSTVSATATTTLANIPTSVLATANSTSQITVSWSGDATEYYVENITGSTNSGWVTSTSEAFTSLTCGTQYSFRVKGRNYSLVETDFSSSSSATTNSCPVVQSGGGGASPAAPSFPAVSVPAILNQVFSIANPVQIKVGNASHKLQVNKINLSNNEANFTIESTPINFTLKVNEEKVLDTDGDKQNDIRVKLNSISALNNTVDLTVISIPDMQFTINHFDISTASRDVTLYFNSPEAKQMAISETEDFSKASYETYQKTKKWKLSSGYGNKKLYVKFRTALGGEKQVASSINLVEKIESVLKKITTVLPAENIMSAVTKFELSNPDSKVVISPIKKLQYTPNSSVAYTYQFKNLTNKTLKIKVVRQVVDAKGKIVSKVNGSASIAKGKAFKFNASSALGSKLLDGNYSIKVQVADYKTGKLLDENSFDISVKKPVVKAVVKKK